MSADQHGGPGTALWVAVLGNLVLSGAHGAVHVLVPVPAEPWQLVVLAVGLGIAPLAGLVAARRGRSGAGAALVGGGAALALAMECPWHFLLANPDHVAHAGGGLGFTGTALATVAGDLLVVAVAAASWIRLRGGKHARGTTEASPTPGE